MEEFDIWSPHNQLVTDIYNQENFQCIDTGINSDLCYIFFSSNGLYYPNTKEVFEEQIVKKNRYEWKRVVKNSTIPKKAGKIIYVRDIYKQWYSRGINSRLNTVDKTIEMLKELVQGYRVVTVGSSAGGYMAVLAAIKLNAEFCINFSGQYVISDDLGNPYWNLVKMLKEYQGDIFYFVPLHCEADQKAYQSVANFECIKEFLFNESKHASTMLTGNMSYIIDKDRDELTSLFKEYSGKQINKIIFLFQTVPFRKILYIFKWEMTGFVARKMKKHWNGV